MKKFLRVLFGAAVIAAGAFVVSCSSSDEGVEALIVKVKVELPEGFSPSAAYSGYVVTMGQYSATTDAEGIATFTDVIPDVYDITTSAEITAEQYREMTGKETQNENYVISGTKLNTVISAASTLVSLPTSCAVKQSLVIGKIYYAGKKDLNNKNYLAARYIELFNNSDATVDAAGIYLALIESDNTPAYTLGTTPEYVYYKQIFRIPVGKPVEVKPGESLVIANSAIDHSENGDVNLLDADFEAKDTSSRPVTNNPNTPGIDLIYTAYANISNMNLVQGGPCSVVIFKTTEDVDQWEKVYADGKSSGNRYVKAPVKYIMDGVECLKNKATGVDASTKRLYDYIDAGYTNIEATTGYTGEIVYRKTLTNVDGRRILADTNNSGNDFAVTIDIKPREYK